MVTNDQVKELREKTGISVMQCKNALEEAGGDMEKAMLILRKKGGSIAEKKGDRTLAAGAIQAYVHSNKEVASMVVLRSETDFVAKNEDFIKLAYELALQVAATNPEFVSRTEMPAEKLEQIKALYVKEVEGKPENLKEQILAGKVDSFLKNAVLLEQPYIKDDSLTIKTLLDNATQKFGERIEIEKFVRVSTK
jgi:elongation factor Ts